MREVKLKISEMEARLKELREKHRDLPCFMDRSPDDYDPDEPISIEYRPRRPECKVTINNQNERIIYSKEGFYFV